MKKVNQAAVAALLAADPTVTQFQAEQAMAVLNGDEPVLIPLMLKQSDVCAVLRISRDTAWRWKKNGILKPVTIGDTTRYRRSDIENLAIGA